MSMACSRNNKVIAISMTALIVLVVTALHAGQVPAEIAERNRILRFQGLETGRWSLLPELTKCSR